MMPDPARADVVDVDPFAGDLGAGFRSLSTKGEWLAAYTDDPNKDV
jgi:hypothetical protein